MEFLANPELWIALATLTALEIVLGIDNIIFISILVGKLPAKQQPMARRVGLAGAMLTRIALLFSLSLIMSLTAPLFSVPVIDHGVSGRDLILLIGGLFLIYKSVREIHEKTEGGGEHGKAAVATATFGATIIQIMILDIVFSLDSVITAVGMVNNMIVMVAAIVIAVGVMIAAAGPVSDFVHRHPTVKMLALAFLLLIGFVLIGEGAGLHIPKGYIYFAMAFSFVVEMLNIRMKSKSGPKS